MVASDGEIAADGVDNDEDEDADNEEAIWYC